MVDRIKYKRDLDSARLKLALLERKRKNLLNQLDTEIAELRKDIRALAMLAGESEGFEEGLTQACMDVFLTAKNEFLTPAEVHARLKRSGFPNAEYSNALASITTTLRRMFVKGALETNPNAKGTTAYRLARDPE